MKLYLVSLKKTESGIFDFLRPAGCEALSSDMVLKPWVVIECYSKCETFLAQLSYVWMTTKQFKSSQAKFL